MHFRTLDRIRETRRSAFTFIEAIVAMGITGILAMALYGGMASATFVIQLARENLRASEILLEKMECLRLFTWNQVNDPTYLPNQLRDVYYDDGTTNTTGKGATYTTSLSLSAFPMADRNYSNDLRLVTITVNWKSGSMPRTRTLNTYVGRYGIQNYIIQH